MATQKQESVYNKIMEYYNFIDKLLDIVYCLEDNKIDDEFEVAKSISSDLEKYADQMALQFINYIKLPTSEKKKTDIWVTMDKILTSVHNAREKMAYIKNNPKEDYTSISRRLDEMINIKNDNN